ncbi:MAG: selenocysteine-specific translation elongation factor [candidate division Zixibacteria bacterium]|nr:selenocysteine-specific translation elongation factor [candidate division Zixibacteria bacterium]
MFVLGTAGHIDHGKSSIIKRLTGIEPDRLPEEKARGLTIDLGFAWMELPSGTQVGFVDVPGHEKFVKNMIAGVGSIDACLLVIAADDGWMPQTEEHLQILELLGIKRGLVILNKIDIVEPDWAELVTADIESRLEERNIEFMDIIPVSAVTGDGFDKLTSAMEKLLDSSITRPDVGKARLYADRAFTISGMGTVLTGTLTGGSLKTGQEISLYPSEEQARIRSLQTHKKTIETAVPGSRVAVNVTGSEKRLLRRGIMISGLTNLQTSNYLNAHFKIPPTGRIALKHNSEVVFLLGTAELLGRVLLLEGDMIKPGEEGYGKIKLPENVCPFIGDRFILRLPSPALTIGGGTILDFSIRSKIKRDSDELKYIKSLYPVSSRSIINSVLFLNGSWGDSEFQYVRNSIFNNNEFKKTFEELSEAGEIIQSGSYYFSKKYFDESRERVEKSIKAYHAKSPWSPGLGGKELLDTADVRADESGALLLKKMVEDGILVYGDGIYGHPGHKNKLPDKLQAIADDLLKQYETNPLEAPTRAELEKKGKDYQIIIRYLTSNDKLIDCGGVLLPESELARIKDDIRDYLQNNEKAKSTDLRKHLNTTRKYAIPLLEYMDSIGFTEFDGEYRKLAR